MNLSAAREELEKRLTQSADALDEESVILGYVDGAEVCLMGWKARNPVPAVEHVQPHANSADSMQLVLEGGMDIYYPRTGLQATLKAGDCHVVPSGELHSCVSGLKSVVLVVVGHRARGGS